MGTSPAWLKTPTGASSSLYLPETRQGARKEAVKALLERGWQDVDILRGGEVPARPDKQPHDAAWQEAREGKRGIIVYDEKAEDRAATEHPPRQA